MRISAVIIVYNLEAYIGPAIDSVLGQTRPADEIVVVDDCSTDRSAVLVQAYGERVRYLRMAENSGALMAALHGVKAAGGDIVCMLDGDDAWAANKLAVVEREFTADPRLVLLSHDHRRVDHQGAALAVRDDTHANIAAIRRRARSPEQLSDLLREAVLAQTGFWLGSAYSFRRDCFDLARFERQIARFGPDNLRQTYLDLVIAPFLVLTNERGTVGYAPDTCFDYRVHDQGSMGGAINTQDALKAAMKGRRTNELIELVLRENGASSAHLRRRQLILQQYDYLAALYASDLRTAARLYARLARRHWTGAQLVKESKRLLAVMLFGPERFLAMKQSRR